MSKGRGTTVSCQGGRFFLALAGGLAIVFAAAVCVSGCLCAKRPDKTIPLAKTLKVGPFTVTMDKIELYGDHAVLSWHAPRVLPRVEGKPRNFEFGTGRNSFLVGTDGLEYWMVSEPTMERSDDKVSGRITFDAKGLDLSELAKIEVDGARWVVSTDGDVVVQPDRRINFMLPIPSSKRTVEFTLEEPRTGGGKVTLVAVPIEKPYRGKGAVIGSTARIENRAPRQPVRTEMTDDRQAFTFEFAKLPILWRITAVRLDEPGPWVLTLMKSSGKKAGSTSQKKR